MRWPILTALVAVAALVSACTSGSAPPAGTGSAMPEGRTAAAAQVVATVDGDDWSLPGWATPVASSGFFSEAADEELGVDTRSVDLSWRQVQPTEGGPLDRRSTGSAQGMSFPSLDDQLAGPGRFWMRLFASGADWAPQWVVRTCGVRTYGPDYDGQRHLPIWDDCVWQALLATYRRLFVDTGLRDDPRLVFVYVPGAFTWAEFDYDMIDAAHRAGDLDWATYSRWYSHAWTDLVEVFGAQSHKLVFTGEDYPWGPFGGREDLLARDTVAAGLGIRNGITELSNFHLSEAPAYGSSVQPDGHLLLDESFPPRDGSRVIATENECFNDCGYQTDEPYYAVRQANLKALQLQVNWLYVVPGPSYMYDYPEHWDWVRRELGARPETSPDAWAALRDAQDTYWADQVGPFTGDRAWASRPWVRNLERWLVQVDNPGAVAHRSDVDVHRYVLEKDNGVAHEGLATAVAVGDTRLDFRLDPRFVGAGTGPVQLKVTYWDAGGGFALQVNGSEGPLVRAAGKSDWRTVTLDVPAGLADFSLAASGGKDLVVRFVRVVRTEAPSPKPA